MPIDEDAFAILLKGGSNPLLPLFPDGMTARGWREVIQAYEGAKAPSTSQERCERCGWPIVPEGEAGCWKSNCSMRPMPPLREPAATEQPVELFKYEKAARFDAAKKLKELNPSLSDYDAFEFSDTVIDAYINGLPEREAVTQWQPIDCFPANRVDDNYWFYLDETDDPIVRKACKMDGKTKRTVEVCKYKGWASTRKATHFMPYYVYTPEPPASETAKEQGRRGTGVCGGCDGHGVVGNIFDTDTCPFCKGNGIEVEAGGK